MNEDIEIKQLLMKAGNDLSDKDRFMAELDRKLEAVEDIKAYHDWQIRKSRTVAVTAFVIGGILGALFVAFFLLKPTSLPQFALLLDTPAYVFLMSYKLYFLVSLGLIVIAVTLLSINRLERDTL